MKKALTIILVLITVTGFIFANGSSEAGGTKVLKIGSTSPAATFDHTALQTFQKNLKEVSGGQMDANIHMAGTLGTTAQQYAQLKEGSLDVFLTAFDTTTVLKGGNDFAVLVVPYVFDNLDHYSKFLNSDLGKGMIAEVEKQNGLYFLGPLSPRGPRALSTSNKEVKSVKDVANLKIRVPETQSIYEMWKTWGANPVIISGGELYSSLESGLADGQDNDVVSTEGSALGEVQKYYSEIDYIQQNIVLWFSAKNWNNLNAQQQEWIREALDKSYNELAKIQSDSYATSKQKLIDSGVTFVDVDVNSFKEATAAALGKLDGVLFRKGLYDEIRALNK